MKKQANGRELVSLYYQHALRIVTAIRRRHDEEDILRQLYAVIRDCVDTIKKGDNVFALGTCCAMVAELMREFIPECRIPCYLSNAVIRAVAPESVERLTATLAKIACEQDAG